MKDVFVTEKTFGEPDDPKFGSWWEKGHHEIVFVNEVVEGRAMETLDAFHVLLTRKEWNDIQQQLEDLYMSR